MGELNITFSGICVSLHSGIVPGVPMRTVLPNALAVRFGVVKIPDQDNFLHNVTYYLMPHLAIAKDKIVGGRARLLTGQYFVVTNAKDQPLCRDGNGGFSLNEFAPSVQLAPDVVYEGNALAYFDIYGGHVWTEGGGDDARVTRVAIKTNGTPRLRISPLPGNVEPWGGDTEIETEELYISNLDVEAATEDYQFDFLMNFLVAKGGIPQKLSKRTPGMMADPKPLTLHHLGERLKALGTFVETWGTVRGWREAVLRGDEPEPSRNQTVIHQTYGEITSLGDLVEKGAIDPVPFDPSCSTSNYP